MDKFEGGTRDMTWVYVQNWNYEAAKEIVNDVLADQTGDV